MQNSDRSGNQPRGDRNVDQSKTRDFAPRPEKARDEEEVQGRETIGKLGVDRSGGDLGREQFGKTPKK